MAEIAIFRINYKSDFILTLNSDAGWMTPFCIKFWTGAPSQAYFAGFDGTTYTHCAPVAGDPTKLLVQFDDHHLPIGDLQFQIAYHFTVADFPTSVEDEVINQSSVIIEVDDAPAQVMLDLNGETAPEIEFSLPAYANEAQRIANEEQRIAAESIRIVNEESRIAAETIRQQNEAQRISNEESRVAEFAQIKQESETATSDANAAATLANEKAQLAADKAALADDAATLANQKAQLAADKAELAQEAATLATDKAALAQQKAEYAQTQGDYAKAQGDYANEQGEIAEEDHERADADHTRAESDHATAGSDHTQAGTDHTRAESDHATASADHTQAGQDHTTAASDHSRAESDHTTAASDHTQAGQDHTTAASDHTQAGSDHTRAESDHTRAESDHAAVEVYVDSLGAFDISAYHATGGVLAKYADLTAALGTNGANIPDTLRKGGMSIKFVLSSDNKYVQYMYVGTSTTVDNFVKTNNWEKVNIEDEFNSLLSKVDGAKLQLEQGGLDPTTGEPKISSTRVRSVNFISGYNKVVCNEGYRILGIFEYTKEGTYIGRNVLDLQEYEYTGTNNVKYQFRNTDNDNIKPTDNVLDYIFCDSLLNKKIKALSIDVAHLKESVIDAYLYKTVNPDIASGNRIVSSITGEFTNTVSKLNYANEIALADDLFSIEVLGSPIFVGDFGYAFLDSNDQIVYGEKITTERYTIQNIQNYITAGATKIRISVKNDSSILLYSPGAKDIVYNIDNKIDGYDVSLEQGGYLTVNGQPNDSYYEARCRTVKTLPLGKHEIVCNDGYLIVSVIEYTDNGTYISGTVLSCKKYIYSGSNYVKYTFRRDTNDNISPSESIVKVILYDSTLGQKINRLYDTYPIVGSPEVYISEDTNNVELIDDLSSLYAFYDDLVTNYPDFFVKAANIGMDASNTYELRHYELRLSNPHISNNRDGSGTNLWDFSQYKYKRILLVGGVHSHEVCAMNALALAVKDILQSSDKWAHFIKSNFVIDIVPSANPWGLDNLKESQDARNGLNSNGINLNRNYNSLTPQSETIAMKSLINGLITKGLVGIIDCHNTVEGQAYIVSSPNYTFYKYVAVLTQQLYSMLFGEFNSVWGSGNHFHLWNTDAEGQLHWYGNTMGITSITCETTSVKSAIKLTKDMVVNTINAFGTTLR